MEMAATAVTEESKETTVESAAVRAAAVARNLEAQGFGCYKNGRVCVHASGLGPCSVEKVEKVNCIRAGTLVSKDHSLKCLRGVFVPVFSV